MKSLTMYAKEKYGLPDEWEPYRFESFPHGKESIYAELTGGVFKSRYKSGKRRGRPNYKKPEPGTLRTVTIIYVEHERWLTEWEKRTGNCSNCMGEGEVFKSWHHQKGVTMGVCPKCKGTKKVSK